MPELHWPRRSHYRGDAVDVIGPATVDVPEDAVEHLRSRGWVDPPADGGATDDEVTDEEAADGDADFDTASFIDRSWQSVTSDIEDGAADGHLDAVEAAEEARDSPRDSVLGAVADRRE
jgi:hypothetical protein